eukprot:2123235-Amphidinium_carterae.1
MPLLLGAVPAKRVLRCQKLSRSCPCVQAHGTISRATYEVLSFLFSNPTISSSSLLVRCQTDANRFRLPPRFARQSLLGWARVLFYRSRGLCRVFLAVSVDTCGA